MKTKRQPLPTDLQVLNAIYDRYYQEFKRGSADSPPGRDSADDAAELRESKTYVPIDIEAIARDLDVDFDIVFGRLYYRLDHLHRYRQDDRAIVPFFTRKAGKASNCVNFPYLASVLAGLREDDRRHRGATKMAIASLILSIVALSISSFLAWFLR